MLVFALFCFALPCLSAAPDPIPVGYKIVPTEKLELLKSNNANLVLKLAELEQKLNLLKTPSDELVEQLAKAEKELQLCKQELQSAKSSLASAETLRKEMLNSLMDLEKEIELVKGDYEQWVTIAAAKRKLNPNTAWNSENVVPKYNLNGVTDFIVSSCYGHIEGEAHTYTPEQWLAHLGFMANRDFRWAYEKDLIDFD